MIDADSLEYACARLAARYGQRPGEGVWRAIGAIRELPALLDAARALPLRPWVAGIAPGADAHAIDARLIAHWRAQVEEVGRWMPDAWRAAIAWAGVLAELPVVAHLARGGEVLAWMREDPIYGPLCDAAPARPDGGALAALAPAWADADRLPDLWRDEWSRRVPRGAFVDTALVDACARAIVRHRAAPAGGAGARRALAARLSSLFRRATVDPAAAFAFLALCALDLERLRGELLLRAIFPRLVPAP